MSLKKVITGNCLDSKYLHSHEHDGDHTKDPKSNARPSVQQEQQPGEASMEPSHEQQGTEDTSVPQPH